jgi:ABC-type dipeptide/oligopeptide/nickel transport system permease component
MNTKERRYTMNTLLLKLAVIAFVVTVIIPIFKVYITAKTSQKAKEKPKAGELSFTDLKKIKEIYINERKPYYEECRILFNTLCKRGKMHKEDVTLIKMLLESSLGDYVSEYKGYKFQNEYQRVYTYMKNWHITKQDWERILIFLNELYESETVTNSN